MRPLFAVIMATIAPLVAASEIEDMWDVATWEWQSSCKDLSNRCATASIVAGRGNHPELIKYLLKKAEKLPDNATYVSGRHIMCYQVSNGPNGFCLFFENLQTAGEWTFTAQDVREGLLVMQEKMKHDNGCKKRCAAAWRRGWAPDQRLKLDYVTEKVCEGLC
ncbi:hypothetical protein JDV02_001685 [Purpureocillium takamizusanense]|uniref:Uncharacterized protein n=1 Tax=Purpureocillium takamizusanense TaxID=2060973 RepID=A0A9Q8Q9R6_9HYPO|nr:uncharacterized protein JDV02_001685 [Purpureocillium takamizusanense]UNI15119.1 hypothetical protein JDV02_001685 [Purpureocillium takamizusanense]